MRGRTHKVALLVAGLVAWTACGMGVSLPAHSQPKPQPAPTQPQAKPGQPAAPTAFDVCKGLTGATAEQKVEACTEAIKDGKLAPGDQALA
ncbi:MAG: hypothetical protein FJX11_02710 [Alphaproteobacteria bacterium]|nr:hypothetical protein [Alphaproteobacteria bacterium]